MKLTLCLSLAAVGRGQQQFNDLMKSLGLDKLPEPTVQNQVRSATGGNTTDILGALLGANSSSLSTLLGGAALPSALDILNGMSNGSIPDLNSKLNLSSGNLGLIGLPNLSGMFNLSGINDISNSLLQGFKLPTLIPGQKAIVPNLPTLPILPTLPPLGSLGDVSGLLDRLTNLTNIITGAKSPATGNRANPVLVGLSGTFISNKYLNEAGKNALRMTGLANKALNYPELLSALNGRTPAVDDSGRLTTAVIESLKKMDIQAEYPEDLIANAIQIATGMGRKLQATGSDVETALKKFEDALARTMAAQAIRRRLQINPFINSLYSPIYGSLDPSYLFNTGASIQNNQLNADVISEASKNNVINSNAKPGSINREFLMKGSPLDYAYNNQANEGKTLGSVMETNPLLKGIRRALSSLKGDSPRESSITRESFRQLLSQLTPAHLWEAVENPKAKRQLSGWFDDTFGKMLNAVATDNPNWKNDIQSAANELAESLSDVSERLKNGNLPEQLEEWWGKFSETAAKSVAEKIQEIQRRRMLLGEGLLSLSPSLSVLSSPVVNPLAPGNILNPLTPVNLLNALSPTNLLNPLAPGNLLNPLSLKSPLNPINQALRNPLGLGISLRRLGEQLDRQVLRARIDALSDAAKSNAINQVFTKAIQSNSAGGNSLNSEGVNLNLTNTMDFLTGAGQPLEGLKSFLPRLDLTQILDGLNSPDMSIGLPSMNIGLPYMNTGLIGNQMPNIFSNANSTIPPGTWSLADLLAALNNPNFNSTHEMSTTPDFGILNWLQNVLKVPQLPVGSFPFNAQRNLAEMPFGSQIQDLLKLEGSILSAPIFEAKMLLPLLENLDANALSSLALASNAEMLERVLSEMKTIVAGGSQIADKLDVGKLAAIIGNLKLESLGGLGENTSAIHRALLEAEIGKAIDNPELEELLRSATVEVKALVASLQELAKSGGIPLRNLQAMSLLDVLSPNARNIFGTTQRTEGQSVQSGFEFTPVEQLAGIMEALHRFNDAAFANRAMAMTDKELLNAQRRLDELFPGIRGTVTGGLNEIMRQQQVLLNSLGGGLSNIGGTVGGELGNLGNGLNNLGGNLMNRDGFIPGLTTGLNIPGLTQLTGVLSNGGSQIGQLPGQLGSQIGRLPGQLGAQIGQLPGQLGAQIGNQLSNSGLGTGKVIGGALPALKGISETLEEQMNELNKAALNVMMNPGVALNPTNLAENLQKWGNKILAAERRQLKEDESIKTKLEEVSLAVAGLQNAALLLGGASDGTVAVEKAYTIGELVGTLADSNLDVNSLIKSIATSGIDLNAVAEMILNSSSEMQLLKEKFGGYHVDLNEVAKRLADIDLKSVLTTMKAANLDLGVLLSSSLSNNRESTDALSGVDMGVLLGDTNVLKLLSTMNNLPQVHQRRLSESEVDEIMKRIADYKKERSI